MICEANYQDLDEVFALMNELEDGTLEKNMFTKQFQRCMEDKNVYIYLYKEDGVKACITLYVHYYLHHRCITGEIGELIVKNEYRGQKIGQQLLDYVEEMGKKLQLEEISLSSGMKRVDAHRFYQRNGYIKDHFCFEKKLRK